MSFKDEERLHAERLHTERLHTDYLQTSPDPLTTDADTQLGAFGPGADPTRSRAAYPPPRLDVNLFLFLLLASWKPGLGVLETRLGVLDAGFGVL